MLFIRKFIKKNYILVNNKNIKKVNFYLKLTDIITFFPGIKRYLKKIILYKLKNYQIIYNIPFFLYINYKILYIKYIYYPSYFQLKNYIKTYNSKMYFYRRNKKIERKIYHSK
jgi:hypothetical protein